MNYAVIRYNHKPFKHKSDNEADEEAEFDLTPYQVFYENTKYKYTYVQFGIECIVKVYSPAELLNLGLPVGEKYSPPTIAGSILDISNGSNSFIVLFQKSIC